MSGDQEREKGVAWTVLRGQLSWKSKTWEGEKGAKKSEGRTAAKGCGKFQRGAGNAKKGRDKGKRPDGEK